MQVRLFPCVLWLQKVFSTLNTGILPFCTLHCVVDVRF